MTHVKSSYYMYMYSHRTFTEVEVCPGAYLNLIIGANGSYPPLYPPLYPLLYPPLYPPLRPVSNNDIVNAIQSFKVANLFNSKNFNKIFIKTQ